MERVYAGHLCYGPPIEEGFYYDMFSADYRVFYNLLLNGIKGNSIFGDGLFVAQHLH